MTAGSNPTGITEPADRSDAASGMRRGVGEYLADMRRQRGWTLSEVARRTGVSISTLSKIENNQTAPAYSVLVKLADGLDVDFGALLGGDPSRPATGARTVTLAGQGVSYANDMGRYEALATELAAKSMEPMIIEIPPDDGSRTHVRSEHEGEEFVYVLSGEVVFEMAPYAPRLMAAGDSVYFDGRSSHGFSARGSEPARILSVCQIRRGGMPIAGDPLFQDSDGTDVFGGGQ